MITTGFRIVFLHGRRQLLGSLFPFIRIDGLIIDKVCSSRHIQRYRICIFYINVLVIQFHFSSRYISLRLRFHFNNAPDSFMIRSPTLHNQFLPFSQDLAFQRRIISDCQIQLSRLISHIPDDHNRINLRSKYFPLIMHAIRLILRCRYGGFQIQIPIIIRNLFRRSPFNHQAAQRQVRHSVRSTVKSLVDQLLGFCILSGKNQVSDRIQMGKSCRIVVPMRTTSPKGFFIQLDLFPFDSTINHSSQTGISQRQCFRPAFGWLLIP